MTEQQAYDVVEQREGYEVRHYPEHLVAEVRLDADFEAAATTAFRRLVSYIGGANTARQSIAMTAPVIQQPQGPAGEPRSGSQVVSFVLPASMSAGEPPVPTDPSVTVRRVGKERAAAVRFSGRWTWGSYHSHVDGLLGALARDGIEPAGPPRFARYDPPWTPWFLRRNEVLIPIAG